MQCYGRRVIYTSHFFVSPATLPEILTTVWDSFGYNQADTQELYDIYRGKHKILNRKKEQRPNICHNTVVNYPNEIVSFKTAYFLSEPVQYVSAGDDEKADTDGVPELVTKLNRLNAYMRRQNKSTRDKEIVDWAHISGTSYRMVLPNSARRGDMDSPFSIYTLDPRWTFVAYYGGIDHRPVLAGVVVPKDSGEGCLVSCYGRNMAGLIISFSLDYPQLPYSPLGGHSGGDTKVWTGAENQDEIQNLTVLDLPAIPIIEYPANMARLGAFEVVLGLVDKINLLSTDQSEDVEQNVQAVWVFQNCKIDEAGFAEASAGKALQIKSEGSGGNESKVYVVSNSLDMSGTQTAIEGARAEMLDICGMPATQNGRASTSDTGSAVIMRDGWQQAEARAKDLETIFRESEARFLEIALYITWNLTDLDLKPYQIEPKFNRRNYADLLTRVQSLTTMLGTDKIAPQLAFEHCGLFTDPEAAYALSAVYYAQRQKELAAQQAEQAAAGEAPAPGGADAVPETQQEASA